MKLKCAAKLALAAGLLLGSLGAQAAVSVVKVINFSCPYCKSTESMDPPIRRAVEAAGGSMVYAAMPADANSDGSRERMYYAAREAYPELEPRIRASLYKGAQDLGYPLASALQSAEWLSTDLADLNHDWTRVARTADDGEPLRAFQRAIRLAVQAGVQALPAYVVVKDGVVLHTLDVQSGGGNYSALRQAVLDAVSKAAAPSNTTP
jgi:protein-disulfide isomerase